MGQISYQSEIYRKLFHILTILIIPAFSIFLNQKQLTIFLIIATSSVLACDLLRHRIRFVDKIFLAVFSSILRAHEIKKNKLTGASFTCISSVLTFTFFPKPIAFTAFIILAISDSCASLVGRKIKSAQFFEKSVSGSLAFGLSALLILVVCGLFFKQEFVFYSFGILAIFVTTIIEARPSLFGKLDDNFTIPLSFSLVMYLLGIIWDINYYPSF